MQHEAQSVDLSVLRELRPGEQLLWWVQPDPKRQVRTNNTLVYIIYGILISVLGSLFYFFSFNMHRFRNSFHLFSYYSS